MKTTKIEIKSIHNQIKEYWEGEDKRNRMFSSSSRIGMLLLAFVFISVAVAFSLSSRKDISSEVGEKQALVRGLVTSIGGRIVSIDFEKKQFTMRISDRGDAKLYTIAVEGQTNFMAVGYALPTAAAKNSGVLGENENFPVKMPPKLFSFSKLRPGMLVEVRMVKYLDLNGASSFVKADRINIIETRTTAE